MAISRLQLRVRVGGWPDRDNTMVPGTGDRVPFPAFLKLRTKCEQHSCPGMHTYFAGLQIVLGHFMKHSKEMSQNQISAILCVSMSGDGDCSFVIAFYSISFQYPAPSSAGHAPPDPSRPAGQTLALVGPGPGKTRSSSSLAPSLIQKGRITIFAPPEPAARLASPGPGRGASSCRIM